MRQTSAKKLLLAVRLKLKLQQKMTRRYSYSNSRAKKVVTFDSALNNLKVLWAHTQAVCVTCDP